MVLEVLSSIKSDAKQVSTRDVFLLQKLLDANRLPSGWQDFFQIFRQHFELYSCDLNLLPVVSEPVDAVSLQSSESLNCSIGEDLQSRDALVPDSLEYDQWQLAKNDAVYQAAIKIKVNHHSFSFHHSKLLVDGNYQVEALNRIDAFLPYIVKALITKISLLENKQGKLKTQALLNKLRFPVALINVSGKLLAINNLMQQLISHNSVLALTDGAILLVSEMEENIQPCSGSLLSENFNSRLITAHHGLPAYRLVSERLEGNVNSSKSPLIDDSLPDDFSGCLVYAVSSQMLLAASIEKIQSLFNLTYSESVCCHLLSQGFSIKEIAQKEEKSINTVREQLHSSYKKTRTTNQLELINILASLPAN